MLNVEFPPLFIIFAHISIFLTSIEARLGCIQEFADFKVASMVRIPLTFSKFLNSFFFSFCLSSERIVDEK